jgi:hypothetical protein
MRASTRSRAEVEYDGDIKLIAVGVEVSTVHTTQDLVPLRSAGSSWDAFASQLFALMPPLANEKIMATTDSVFEKYVRVLGGDDFAERVNPAMRRLPTYESIKQSLPSWWSAYQNTISDNRTQTNTETSVLSRVYHSHELAYSIHRTLFQYEGGGLGLGPEVTRIGDKVCVLLGCDSPLILRPESGVSWSVIGECLANNCNCGEAISGPLPENCRPIEQLTSDGSYVPA